MLVRPEPEGTDPLLAAAPIYRSCGLYSVRSTRTESGVAEYIWIGYNVCVATHSSQPCKVLGPLTTAFIMPRGNRASWVSDIPIVTPHPAFEVAVGNTHQKASTPGNRRVSSTKPSLGTPRPRRNMSHVGLGCPTLVNVHAMALASCLMNERNRDSLSERSKPGKGWCDGNLDRPIIAAQGTACVSEQNSLAATRDDEVGRTALYLDVSTLKLALFPSPEPVVVATLEAHPACALCWAPTGLQAIDRITASGFRFYQASVKGALLPKQNRWAVRYWCTQCPHLCS